MIKKTPLSLALVLSLSLAASAQTLTLDKTGGAVPGTTTWTITGPAGAPYLLLYSLTEQATPFGPLMLDIPLDFVPVSLLVPGFTGNLNGAGIAQPSYAVPNDPALIDLAISCQAVANVAGTAIASNLVRLTMAAPGTFTSALNAPTVPILGGGTAIAGDGELLFVGGSGPVAQKYASRTEEWALSGATFGVGLFSQTTGLADGRVLFTGGLGLDGQPTDAAAIYDPVTQATTNLTMSARRAGHGASRMGNGRVLITGGFSNFTLTDPLVFFQGIQATTEVFDPVAGTFAAGPVLLEARAFHSSTTLTSGQVLIAGGLTLLPIVNLPTVSATAYRFNPASNSFGLPAFFSGSRFLHSAVALSNGKVLLVGGMTLDLTQFLTTFDPTTIIIGTRTDCQVYTSSFLGFGTFATVNGMSEGRAGAAVAALPNGGALIAGGFNLTINVATATFISTTANSADRFIASPASIVPTGSMASARLFPITANLPDGTVLVLGGGPFTAEIYQP